MHRFRLLCLVSALALAALALGTARAEAAGGNYVFDGGTQYEQQQVRQALAASSFNWSVVPGQVTVHIRGSPPLDELVYIGPPP